MAREVCLGPVTSPGSISAFQISAFKTMRILSVCSNYRVFGAETITLKMLEGFKLRGHEQVAVTSYQTDGEFGRRLAGLGIREEIMPF